MNVPEIFSNIASELSKIGVDIAKDPALTVNQIIDIADDLDLETIEELLNRLISYNIYLKSQKGSYEAQLIVKEGNFRRLLYLETQSITKQSSGGSYLTKEEKEALVLSGKLKDHHEEILKLKAIVARIRDVPFAVDKKIEYLKMKYRRLMDEYRTASRN